MILASIILSLGICFHDVCTWLAGVWAGRS